MNLVAGVVRDGAFECAAGRIACGALPAECREALFRPESVSLSGGGDGALMGHIAAVFFLGDRTRLLVDGFGERPVVMETGSHQAFAVGEPIALRIDPAALFAL